MHITTETDEFTRPYNNQSAQCEPLIYRLDQLRFGLSASIWARNVMMYELSDQRLAQVIPKTLCSISTPGVLIYQIFGQKLSFVTQYVFYIDF